MKLKLLGPAGKVDFNNNSKVIVNFEPIKQN